MDVARSRGAPKQHAPAEALAHCRGQRGPADAHVKHEDEDGVEDDVEDGARGNADHAETGVALKSQLVVERQRRHHERRGDEDETQVVVGVGEDAVGGTHGARQGRDEQQTTPTCHGAQNQWREESCGCHASGVLSLLGTHGA